MPADKMAIKTNISRKAFKPMPAKTTAQRYIQIISISKDTKIRR
jgi:hypothetical protein